MYRTQSSGAGIMIGHTPSTKSLSLWMSSLRSEGLKELHRLGQQMQQLETSSPTLRLGRTKFSGLRWSSNTENQISLLKELSNRALKLMFHLRVHLLYAKMYEKHMLLTLKFYPLLESRRRDIS